MFNKRQKLPFHTNGMRFTAFAADGSEIATRDYYSVGGGFVVNQDEAAADRIVADTTAMPYPFHSGDELLRAVRRPRPEHRRADVGERARLAQRGGDPRRPAGNLGGDAGLRGARHPRQGGVLPGGLKVTRRAPAMLQRPGRRARRRR